jgi:hypothetical protein
MNRDVDPVVARAREVLEPLLDQLGFTLASELHNPGAFGSVNTEYRRRGHRIELTWDGKDRWLWLKVAPTGANGVVRPGAWQDLEAALGDVPSVQVLRPGPVTEARLERLAAAVRRFFRLDAAI